MLDPWWCSDVHSNRKATAIAGASGRSGCARWRPDVQRPALKSAASRPDLVIVAFAAALSCVLGSCVLGGCGSREQLDFGTITNVEDSEPTAETDVSETAETPHTGAPQPAAPPAATVAPSATQPSQRQAIQGRLVDFWGHPVPDVELDVGGVRTVSAGDGSFYAPDVAEVYDLSFVLQIDGEAYETYGWTYQGLTQRAPVLQVFRGLAPRRATLRVELPSEDVRPLPCGSMAFGGQHGHQAFAIYQVSTAVSVVWRGVDAVPLNVQSLFWEPTDVGECDVPRQFLGWRQHDTVLSPGDDVTLLMEDPAVSRSVLTSSLTALVHSGDEGSLDAALFLRFTNGATLPVTSTTVENGVPFSFAVPVVEDTTLIVAASRSDVNVVDQAVAYTSLAADGLRDIELQPPATPRLLAPVDAARLAPAGAVFEWDNAGSVAMLVVTHQERFMTQFVVTANQRVELPDLSHLGLVLEPDAPYSWDVESHRNAPTVDEWLEAEFPLDPFSIDFATPVGPQVTSGTFARSAIRAISFSSR